ncbi:MAG: HAD family hydrolase [Deinococcota bacterium]|jgi:HAD superfamily hydrolase (TIGR01549 family)|nr:HAD family hydrolase [Deinococcota bacterium]
MKTAILFDFDGTLVTYRGNFPTLMFAVADGLEIPAEDREAFADELVQGLLRDGAVTLHSAALSALQILGYRAPAAMDEVIERTLLAYSHDIRVRPGARELLARAAREMPLALVTNGPSDMQRRALEASGLAGYFESVLISGDDDVASRKPHPLIFGLACERLGVLPRHTLMVGDNREADISGALASGLQAIEVGPDADLLALYGVIKDYLEAG